MANSILQRSLKRSLDLFGATAGLITLSPVLTGITALEMLFHGWPPVFIQVRPGEDEKPFAMYKFRSMTNAHDAQGKLLPDAERLTSFGAFLRKTSLDELPELLNVLLGDMSLVGPRPLLMRYLERYNDDQKRRHNVKPGITGWAQIHGRNALSWNEKFALDLWYVDNQSFTLDVRILLKTIYSVIAREGISAQGSATMPEFMGETE